MSHHFHLYVHRTGTNYTAWCCASYDSLTVQLRDAGNRTAIPATEPTASQWVAPHEAGASYPPVVIERIDGPSATCE